MLLAGIGIGMVTPVLTLAVQNAVPFEELGVATSTSTFLRQMGGSFGAAIYGAVQMARLDLFGLRFIGRGFTADKLNQLLLQGAASGATGAVPESFRHTFDAALHTVFLGVVPAAALAVVAACFIPEVVLRSREGLARPEVEPVLG